MVAIFSISIEKILETSPNIEYNYLVYFAKKYWEGAP